MKLSFDYYHNLEQVELYLCNPDGRELFPLPGRNRNLVLRFNDLSELTIDVDSTVSLSDGSVVALEAYDYVRTKRLIYASNIGWFQITSVEDHDDGATKYKSVASESLQSVLKNKGFISEERVYCFYNQNDPYDDMYDASSDDGVPSVMGQWSKQLGIKQALDQGLDEPAAPYDDWTVTYIGGSRSHLIYTGESGTCRTFKANTTYGYDWMVNDVENAFEVVVLFDFMYKTIHVMSPDEVTQKANVVYTFNNFMKSINVTENADDIVTVLNCNGDNCNITAVNPTGTNYICDFSYYMDKANYRWMSPALIARLERWQAACDNSAGEYQACITELSKLLKSKTELTTTLQTMSLALQDLKNAQGKRDVVGRGAPGALCGVITAESVKIGSTSLKRGTIYYSKAFTGDKVITAYCNKPTYNAEESRWIFSGNLRQASADTIISDNLSDSNSGSEGYWYFSDTSDGSSYCKLQSAVKADKDTGTTTYSCGGFDRYIAYTYPLIDDDTGALTYTDTLQSWIDLRESIVEETNIKIYGCNHETEYPTGDSIYRQIKSVSAVLDQISSRLNLLKNLSDSPELLRELNCYWIEGDYTNDNISISGDSTPENDLALANELLASGRVELSKVCQPRFSFSIESVDVTKQYEFREQMRELELGKIVTIEKEEGVWYYPVLLELSINLDDSDEFSMTFANALRLDDWGYTYADLITDASATSRQVSANWQDITAYSKNRDQISSILKDPLDTTRRAMSANMVNQEFTVDKNGILGRKRISETSGDFEDEQVRLINNLLMFTDDNWATAKTALGKIVYKDDNNNLVTSYGLIAETIIGSLIVGERLKIKNTNNTVEIGAGGISIVRADNGAAVFQAQPDGSLELTGKITATAGSIGGCSIVDGVLQVAAANITGRLAASQINGDGLTVKNADVGDMTITGKLKFGGNKTYYINYAGSSGEAYLNLPGLRVNEDGAVFSGKLSAATGTFSGVIALGKSDTNQWVYIDSKGIRVGSESLKNYTDFSWNSTTIHSDQWSTGNPVKLQLGSYTPLGSEVCEFGIRAKLDPEHDGTFTITACDNKPDTGTSIEVANASIKIVIGENTSSSYGMLDGTWRGSLASTSDQNAKNSIENLSDQYECFFDALSSRRFKFNEGTSGRYHTGFIAQEVESAILASGLSTQDAALFVKFNTYDRTTKAEDVSYALRYDEFIALNTWQIQKLKARVSELEKTIGALMEGRNEED